MGQVEGIKTSEFMLLAASIVLGMAFGTESLPAAAVSSAGIVGAGLYALGRGLSKRGV